MVQCGWVCVATCAGALKVLISYFSFCVFLFYGLAVLCLLVLRQTREPTPGAYHTPWYVRAHTCTHAYHTRSMVSHFTSPLQYHPPFI